MTKASLLAFKDLVGMVLHASKEPLLLEAERRLVLQKPDDRGPGTLKSTAVHTVVYAYMQTRK